MLVEVVDDFLPFLGLVVGDLLVSFLELAVLCLVLTGYLLVLLSNDLGLSSSVLVLQCLLIVKLLFHLGLNGGGIHLSEEGHDLFCEKFVQAVCALFKA